MDFTTLYYSKFLQFFVGYYREEIKQAKTGHCMKVTGFAESELQTLIGLIRPINPSARVFILSDEKTGQDYIHASKLIEMRNDNGEPLIILIPSNSRTSAEDSYGDATFKDLSVKDLQVPFYMSLKCNAPESMSTIIGLLEDLAGERNIRLNRLIEYMLFLESKDWNIQAWGDGLFCIDLLPDSKLLENLDNVKRRLFYNIRCSEVLCDFSISISDKVVQLPMKPGTLQKDVVKFFGKEPTLASPHEVCEAIYERYPELYFSKWPIKKLEESVENVKVYAELIPGKDPDKELVKDVSNDYVLQIPFGKKSKVKVKMVFNPSPTELPELQKYKIELISQDGYVLRDEVKNAKIAVARSTKTVTLNISNGSYEDGVYFLRVHALDADGMELDKDNPFKPEAVQIAWEAAKKENPELTKEAYQAEHNVLMINETTFFTLVNLQPNDTGDDVETSIDKRRKCDNLLQAYFNYRIESVRKGQELTVPTIPTDTNWKEGSRNDTFSFDFGNALFAYQIQCSKKLLEMERCFYHHSTQLGHVDAEISGNLTDTKLQDLHFIAIKPEIEVPAALLNMRFALFNDIQGGATSESGVINTFQIYNHIDQVRSYIQAFSEWVRKQLETNSIEEVFVALQNIDTVSLSVEMPDGSRTLVKLISPIHPLRLAWLVNMFDLYTDWEEKTVENPEYKSQWYKKLDKLFLGDIPMEVSPLILTNGALDVYQYVGELTFGWGMYAIPTQNADDIFASQFRQLKSYVTSLLNITRERQIDSDVNLDLVLHHIDNYAKAHQYADKIVINLFNAGDANVFADALVAMERRGMIKDYEIRMFADDKLIQPGEALRDLLDPNSNQSDAAEPFSVASSNRLFPKLRFSINSIEDFIKEHEKYQAHISFLVNPFPVTTEMVRPDPQTHSFFLNGVITKSAVSYQVKNKSTIWNRYFSNQLMPYVVNEFANDTVRLFSDIQYLIAKTLSTTSTESVPATCLNLNEGDAMLLSFIHDVSDWVVTFDKNMGPEFYDLPSGENGEIPYLLDYIPGQERTGISSFLTTKPTSEVEGLMIPHFKEFGIDINNSKLFKSLLEDVRTVSSSILLQNNSTQRKTFEVLGITFTQRLLKRKGVLDNSFIIPIDLHKELFEDLDTQSKERADDLVISINTETREIEVTVVEIKCRTSLTEEEEEKLEEKILSQINNTIVALESHFAQSLEVNERLDRELKTMELGELLSFYIKRSLRYKILKPEIAKEYLDFLNTLNDGYTIDYKKMGIIFNMGQEKKQRKDLWGDATMYMMGKPVIADILSEDKPLDTFHLDADDVDFVSSFPTSRRITIRDTERRETSPRSVSFPVEDQIPAESDDVTEPVEPVDLEQVEDEPEPVIIPKQKGYKEDDIDPVDSMLHDSHDDLEATRKRAREEEARRPAEIEACKADDEEKPDRDYIEPKFDVLVGSNSPTAQFGILGKTLVGNKTVAVDLDGCNTFSLFGVQGAGKSYTIGTVAEMTLKQFSNVNKLKAPLASVIFHYSDTMDYAPEFTSMIYPNNEAGQLAKLKQQYGAEPGCIKDVIMLVPENKVDERQEEYPDLEIHPIGFDSSELQVKDWMFLIGAMGNDSTYIHEIKQILKRLNKEVTLRGLKHGVAANQYLSQSQKNLANQRLSFAEDYITDGVKLQQYMKPGRLIIVDLRDEFIEKDEALGLFVVMLNIFSGVKTVNGQSFNKFIVFDEAHKYMDDKKMVDSITVAIKEMRHKGVSIMIASQNPVGLPTEIIELSSIILLHKFNSPAWVKHIQKSITSMQSLSSADLASLGSGEAYLWANKATEKTITIRPMKISIRPRVTKHGGETIHAVNEE